MSHSSSSDNNVYWTKKQKNEKGKKYVLYPHIGYYVITTYKEMDRYSIILLYTKYFVRRFINAVIFIEFCESDVITCKKKPCFLTLLWEVISKT